ncbi:hypothetical protein JQ604_25965 [Bradyrhizobium jicamae]|uniref:hypothetical protein n=1 Tax=Bradyrhizobium jicamae TaxID=280332 RepID=UPI001BA6C93B|nr:hypothetical protein [Bradyrhizobium jicamae]MBR0755639.1 hypothetical protein [Bradyrhizobium jicamae]
MRRSPTLVPQDGADQDTYVVLSDLGRLGRVWCEADEEDTDREALIRDLMKDQYSHPARIVAFNTTEGWSRDVTEEIAEEVWTRCSEIGEIPASVQSLLETVGKL